MGSAGRTRQRRHVVRGRGLAEPQMLLPFALAERRPHERAAASRWISPLPDLERRARRQHIENGGVDLAIALLHRRKRHERADVVVAWRNLAGGNERVSRPGYAPAAAQWHRC